LRIDFGAQPIGELANSVTGVIWITFHWFLAFPQLLQGLYERSLIGAAGRQIASDLEVRADDVFLSRSHGDLEKSKNNF
jgi:hypothetical protein